MTTAVATSTATWHTPTDNVYDHRRFVLQDQLQQRGVLNRISEYAAKGDVDHTMREYREIMRGLGDPHDITDLRNVLNIYLARANAVRESRRSRFSLARKTL